MARKANWAAVGAIAAAASALVAFLAYTAPHSPYPFPASESPPYARPPQKQTGPPATTTPGFAFPGPTLAQPAGPPVGCQQGEAAIARYNQTVGSTSYSKFQAAQRAQQDVEMAQNAAASANGTSGAINEDLQGLSQGFTYLSGTAQGGPSFEYNTVLAQTQKDIQALNTDCNAAG